jgi:DNA-binding GntR family transcriptional regulator
VTQAQLADAYDLGRAAVRLALNRLSQEQLVQVVPRQGCVIAPVTLNDVRELFGLRVIIEPAAARLAAGRLDDRQLRHLDQLCASRFRVHDHQGIEAFRRHNTAFHLAVARGSGNGRLVEMIASVLHRMERVLNLPYLAKVYNRYEDAYRDHRLLLDALRAGDARRAEQTMFDHIAPTEKVIIDIMIHSPSLQSVNLAGASPA